MKILAIIKASVLIAIYLMCSAQSCKQVMPTTCDGVEFFYGPLDESHVSSWDGNDDYLDRLYTADLYYKGGSGDIKSIQIEFQKSMFETVQVTPLLSPVTSTAPLVLTTASSFSDSGSDCVKIATVTWRIKYQDSGNTALGVQQFTFLDASGQPISGCAPTYIDPPSLTMCGNTELQ